MPRTVRELQASYTCEKQSRKDGTTKLQWDRAHDRVVLWNNRAFLLRDLQKKGGTFPDNMDWAKELDTLLTEKASQLLMASMGYPKSGEWKKTADRELGAVNDRTIVPGEQHSSLPPPITDAATRLATETFIQLEDPHQNYGPMTLTWYRDGSLLFDERLYKQTLTISNDYACMPESSIANGCEDPGIMESWETELKRIKEEVAPHQLMSLLGIPIAYDTRYQTWEEKDLRAAQVIITTHM